MRQLVTAASLWMYRSFLMLGTPPPPQGAGQNSEVSLLELIGAESPDLGRFLAGKQKLKFGSAHSTTGGSLTKYRHQTQDQDPKVKSKK